MPRVPIRIPNLVGGVSRQPPSQRNLNQVEEATNVLLHYVRGASKRPGTRPILSGDTSEGKLDISGTVSNPRYHWIDRDADERWLVIVTEDATATNRIQIFDLEGTKETVNWDDTEPQSYIVSGSTNAKQKIRAMTVADATFFLNNTVPTALTGDAITYYDDGADTMTGTPIREQTIGTDPATTRNLETWENFDLPGSITVTEIYSARFDESGHPAGFYEAISNGSPPWYERVRTEGANSEIDAETFPFRMDYDGVDFHVSLATWDDRLTGDSQTNPGPSIIGSPISAMTFYESRFWFGAGENIASSQTGDLFNLWLDSIEVVGDSDPIDVSSSTRDVNNVRFMLPTQNTMVVMTDGGQQLQIQSDQGALTPSSVIVRPTTLYSTKDVDPVLMGFAAYFVGENLQSTVMYEYFLDTEIRSQVLANEATLHVPDYLPKDPELLAVAPALDLVILHCGETTASDSELYFYQPKWAGTERIQQAWFKWDFDSSATIETFHVYDNVLYILFKYGSDYYLEKVDLDEPDVETDMDIALRLDRAQLVSGTYVPATKSTYWDLTFEDTSIDDAVLGGDWGTRAGERLQVTNTTHSGVTRMTAEGKWDDHDVWIGRSYTMDLTLSEQFLRNENGIPVQGTLQLVRGLIRHVNTGHYQFQCTPEARSTIIKEFNAARTGGINAVVGTNLVEPTGEFTFPIGTSANGSVLKIVSDAPYPCRIVSVEFNAVFVPQRSNPTR